MICVGIDPSLTCTAVCIGPGLTQEPSDVLMSKFTSKPAGSSVGARMGRYEDLVARICEAIETAGRPEVICIEGYVPFLRHGAQALMEFGGLLRWNLVPLCDRIEEVPPSSLKKFCCGNGGPGKTGTATSLSRRYGVDFGGSDDCYDAFGLFRMALVIAGGAVPTAKFEHDVLARMFAGKADEVERRLAKMFDQPKPF
jgi:hypothetical protein